VRSNAQTNASRENDAPARKSLTTRFEHHARPEIVCRSHGRRRLADLLGRQWIERMTGGRVRQGLGDGIGHGFPLDGIVTLTFAERNKPVPGGWACRDDNISRAAAPRRCRRDRDRHGQLAKLEVLASGAFSLAMF